VRLAKRPFPPRRHSGVHSYPYDPTAKPIQSSHPYGETTTRDRPLRPLPTFISCSMPKPEKPPPIVTWRTPDSQTQNVRGKRWGVPGLARTVTQKSKQCIARAPPGVKYTTPNPPFANHTSPHVQFIYAARAWRLGRKAKRSSVSAVWLDIDRTRSETWIRRRGDRSFQRWGARDGGGRDRPRKVWDDQRSAKPPLSRGPPHVRNCALTRPPHIFSLRQWRSRLVIGTSKHNVICFFPLRGFFWGLSVWHSLDGNRIVKPCEKGGRASELGARPNLREGGLGDVAMEERNSYDARCARVA